MIFLDKVLEGGECLNPAPDPGGVSAVLLLPVLEDSVGVEHPGILHLLDEGGGSGGDSDPAQGGNALRHSGQVIEHLAPSVRLPELLDLPNKVGGGLEQLLQVGIGRLLGRGGSGEELSLGLEGGGHNGGVAGGIAPDVLTGVDEGGE